MDPELAGELEQLGKAKGSMHHKTRTSLCNGVLLALLAVFVVGLFALVWSGLPSPRLPGGRMRLPWHRILAAGDLHDPPIGNPQCR